MQFKTKPAPSTKAKAKKKPSPKNSPMLKQLAAMAQQGAPPQAAAGGASGYTPQWPQS